MFFFVCFFGNGFCVFFLVAIGFACFAGGLVFLFQGVCFFFQEKKVLCLSWFKGFVCVFFCKGFVFLFGVEGFFSKVFFCIGFHFK